MPLKGLMAAYHIQVSHTGTVQLLNDLIVLKWLNTNLPENNSHPFQNYFYKTSIENLILYQDMMFINTS